MQGKITVHFYDAREATYDNQLAIYGLSSVPQKGSYIWFPERVDGFSSWVVDDEPCYWVASGEVCVYIVPTEFKETVVQAELDS